jgi:hypothetical protein
MRTGAHQRKKNVVMKTYYNAKASEKINIISMPTNSLFSSPLLPSSPPSSKPLLSVEKMTEMLDERYPTDRTP